MFKRSEFNCEASLETREEMLMECGSRRGIISETAAGLDTSGATGSTAREECGLSFRKGEDGEQTNEEDLNNVVVKKQAGNWKHQKK